MVEFASSAELRAEVAQACRVLARFRIVEGFGHITCRVPGTDLMMITPRKALGIVEPDELVEFDQNGNRVGGGDHPPLEFHMHLAVYKARPDVMAIARGHPRNVAAYSAASEPLRIAHGFGANLGHVVPLHDEPYLVTNPESGAHVAEVLGDCQGVILRGNGMLAVGQSIQHACVNAIFMEEAAEVQLKARAAGMEPKYFTPEEATRRNGDDRVHEPVRGWEYYLAVAEGRITL
jgi:ribulose-5-phosphate 4-epimerase/fuculose-1-phosphate aldolase